jgi:hypothetical protein
MPNALFGVAKKTRHHGQRLPAYIKTVARMSHHAAFCIDSPASGARCGKNRLLSVSGMTKISQRWRDDHRHTRICGRR